MKIQSVALYEVANRQINRQTDRHRLLNYLLGGGGVVINKN